jgi:8-oxo-dGTP pyrophosphatase MutT (NUDIX family)
MSIFCKNCGKNGHNLAKCAHPITSYGIVAYRIIEEEIYYLMVCRKNSLGYIDILRGHYDINNKTHTQNLIDEMTLKEKEDVLTLDFHTLWTNMWGSFGLSHRADETTSSEKFESLRPLLGLLINDSKTSWTTPEWGFPKGKRNYQESDFDCAIREWEEETGCNRNHLSVINNLLPYDECFVGSNYKGYKHTYYVANYTDQLSPIVVDTYQQSEISECKWLTYKECLYIIH